MERFYGVLIGAICFLSIGIWHPIVIKGEYYLGRKICAPIFGLIGLLCVGLSLYFSHLVVSIGLAVFGFSALWGVGEVYEQEKRVERGWFPKRKMAAKLSDMTINFLGDSITEGAGAGSYENCYVGRLERSGIFAAVRNYGIGGTRIAPNRMASPDPKWDKDFIGRAKDMEKADIIVIFGGTNDYGHGDAPFGKLTDNTADTFCGAYNVLLEALADAYPEAKLLVVTPLHRYGEDNPRGEGWKAPGKILCEYVDAIINIADAHQVPVLDLYHRPPFPASDDYLADGLHPNDRGHAELAGAVADEIKRLVH